MTKWTKSSFKKEIEKIFHDGLIERGYVFRNAQYEKEAHDAKATINPMFTVDDCDATCIGMHTSLFISFKEVIGHYRQIFDTQASPATIAATPGDFSGKGSKSSYFDWTQDFNSKAIESMKHLDSFTSFFESTPSARDLTYARLRKLALHRNIPKTEFELARNCFVLPEIGAIVASINGNKALALQLAEATTTANRGRKSQLLSFIASHEQ